MVQTNPYFVRPGLHSHNLSRWTVPASPPKRRFSFVRVFFLLVGFSCLGYYAYTVADQFVYQAYENWAFDQQIGGREDVNFQDYVRERTPLGFLAGYRPREFRVVPAPRPATSEAPPAEGAVIGRVAIGRLNLSAVVRQGVDTKTLSEAVGHVPSTSLPGQPGNFAIAAHRDTLFRALKDIRKGDMVTFQSASALFTYQVAATRIVKPTDVSVLHSDGGGLVVMENGKSPNKLLTMITCYPFYYVGSAPERFVVEAKLIDGR